MYCGLITDPSIHIDGIIREGFEHRPAQFLVLQIYAHRVEFAAVLGAALVSPFNGGFCGRAAFGLWPVGSVRAGPRCVPCPP